VSHLRSMKTSFQKLIYLEKALTKLNIIYTRRYVEEEHTQAEAQINLIIPQSNQYDLEFAWNKNSYELVVDLSFWAQPYPIEIFLEKVTQKYVMENLVGKSQNLGFQVINCQKKLEEVTELILERWNY
jgi:Protein of unknown function (DUF1257)